ncbi:hypothetical protein AB835_10890 [Candidatus Endobugula sertula]|uniref:Uncharacterized protein n=1 Tax=Candidatus Endobugula sertula TaxID=62101 RepID=A0A1D2QNC1_9GAMM|nr:hypothetical protein AB835_10890 [Candidatus Endobugula sertula]
MGWNIKGIGNPFNRSVQHKTETEKANITIPDMVKKDSPNPRIKPPSFGQTVDAHYFNERWDAQVKQHQTQDAFDRIDQKNKLSIKILASPPKTVGGSVTNGQRSPICNKRLAAPARKRLRHSTIKIGHATNKGQANRLCANL